MKFELELGLEPKLTPADAELEIFVSCEIKRRAKPLSRLQL